MAYWIFKCNPKLYRLDDRLLDPNPTLTWLVSRYRDEIGPADTAFIWVTGEERGIRAVVRIDESPRIMPEIESEKAYSIGDDNEELTRVKVSLTHRGIRLLHTELREIPGLEDLAVFHGFQQATNFRVTPQQGEILLRLIQGEFLNN